MICRVFEKSLCTFLIIFFWSSDNPHSLHETPLHNKKVGVLVAISRRRIVGPIFFMNTINSERYCWDILHAFIGQMTSDEINYSWFQQDGATAHTSGRSSIH